MKPRIAINCDIEAVAGVPPRRKATLPLDYLDFIRQGGGTPCPIPPGDGADVVQWLRDVDGALFIGGDDYRLANQSGEPHDFVAVDEQRERDDVLLARDALAHDLPVLGICCGFQLLVLVAGGGLHGDLPSEAPSAVVHKRRQENAPFASHAIEWRDPQARVDIPAGAHQVNSHHHQGVCSVPRDWQVLARSEDGLVEAVAGPGRFQVGVQWHPEKDLTSALSKALARALVDSARRRREASS